jgi:hypothetical protein
MPNTATSSPAALGPFSTPADTTLSQLTTHFPKFGYNIRSRSQTVQHTLKYEVIAVVINFSRVEAGANTSIVALQVVGGDEKGTHCLGV